jgi:hypothetical protein
LEIARTECGLATVSAVALYGPRAVLDRESPSFLCIVPIVGTSR